jgi:hypothetical protein
VPKIDFTVKRPFFEKKLGFGVRFSRLFWHFCEFKAPDYTINGTNLYKTKSVIITRNVINR